ncbi:P-II family nitrogen regulator [Desulfovibrio sp. 86]|uniref:Nitrogen fixation nifHD region glnB-like protein 1 n=1 Tax=uncultured Desulfovibrio sp. TaxID=167968 RepID=A0A212L1T5_9BACT|nr:P-II family nitrogen regulator [Desulfovibrio sp. 86]SCM71513.1 Nitrogen fixation nifHD region glnB-like protein 1 [uncultured Desulfovibrio sp.]VZH32920.1 Nitrogen fixation nifHD region glnB-like protein 1 [Desulfovibrio sp. 86]
MKMVRAVIRPESTELVVDALAASGFVALTKIQAFGRGKQKGIDSGNVHYDELPKNLLMLVVEDEHVPQVLEVVQKQAKTGSFGDGKVFVSPVDTVFTIRTGQEGV